MEIQQRVTSALDNLAAIGRNIAAHSEAIIAAEHRLLEFVQQHGRMFEQATAALVHPLAAIQPLPPEFFNIAKREATFAMMERQAIASLVNSFDRVKDVAARAVYANRLVDFVECAKRSPQFARNLIQALSLGRWSTLSRKEFIQNHLMHFAEFRAQLKLEGRAFTKAWHELMYVVKKVVNYLWRSIVKRSIQPKQISHPIPLAAEHPSKKEQIWPLLLAFKNH